MQLRPIRFAIYLLRSLRMVCRGLWRGKESVRFILLMLLPQLIKSSWKVSGLKREPFPSLSKGRP
jgi:hypothetical protein